MVDNKCPNCKEKLDCIDNDVSVEKNETWADFDCAECGYSEKRIYIFDKLEVINDGDRTDNRGEESN